MFVKITGERNHQHVAPPRHLGPRPPDVSPAVSLPRVPRDHRPSRGNSLRPRSLREPREGGSKPSGLPELSPSFRSGAASHTHLEETSPNQPHQNWEDRGGRSAAISICKTSRCSG